MTRATPTRIEMTMEVNGAVRTLVVEPRTTLVDALREDLGLVGTRHGCDEGVCGACIVLVDGEPVLACLMFAAQAYGREVTTIEGLALPGALHPVQEAFVAAGATGCGYCTSGLVMLTAGALAREPEIAEDGLARLAAGNLCRCNGYGPILSAIRAARAAAVTAAE